MPVKKGVYNSSLTSRILFAVVGLILLFGTLASYFVYKISTQNLLEVSIMHQQHLTSDKAKDIEMVIEEVFTVSKQLSEEKLLADGLVASPSPALVKQVTSILNQYYIKDFYSTIYVMGTNGITYFSTDPTFIGKDYSFRPYFKEALKGGNYVDIGLGVTTNKLGYYFSRPVYQDKKVLGVVVIKTSPSRIENIVNYDLLQMNSQTIITDDEGIILYSSRPNRLYASLGKLPSSITRQEQSFRFPGKTFKELDYDLVQREVLKKTAVGSFEIQDAEDNEREVLTYTKVGKYPFYFIIEAEADPYIASAASSAIIVSLFVLAAATIAAFIIALIVSRALSPIGRLVTAADEIGKGNLNYQVPSFSTYELSALAESFKKMSLNLQDLYKNMEIKVLERTKDLDERNKKISESEAAIKDALETSERANKLMVGRELEMLELKKKIKTLKESKV